MIKEAMNPFSHSIPGSRSFVNNNLPLISISSEMLAWFHVSTRLLLCRCRYHTTSHSVCADKELQMQIPYWYLTTATVLSDIIRHEAVVKPFMYFALYPF